MLTEALGRPDLLGEREEEGDLVADVQTLAVLEGDREFDLDDAALRDALAQRLAEALENADEDRDAVAEAHKEAAALAKALALCWLADTKAESEVLADMHRLLVTEGEGATELDAAALWEALAQALREALRDADVESEAVLEAHNEGRALAEELALW